MARFRIDYTREVWLSVEVEAESEEEARENFWAGEYDDEDERETGGEIADDVEIWEVTE